MAAVDLVGPEGRDECRPAVPETACEIAHELQRRYVGPMDVFEDEEQRLRGPVEQAADRLVHPTSAHDLGGRVEAFEIRQQRRELARRWAEHVADVVTEGFDEPTESIDERGVWQVIRPELEAGSDGCHRAGRLSSSSEL